MHRLARVPPRVPPVETGRLGHDSILLAKLEAAPRGLNCPTIYARNGFSDWQLQQGPRRSTNACRLSGQLRLGGEGAWAKPLGSSQHHVRHYGVVCRRVAVEKFRGQDIGFKRQGFPAASEGVPPCITRKVVCDERRGIGWELLWAAVRRAFSQ